MPDPRYIVSYAGGGRMALFDTSDPVHPNKRVLDGDEQLLHEAAHALNNLEPLRAALDACGRYLIKRANDFADGDEQEILATIDKALADSKA